MVLALALLAASAGDQRALTPHDALHWLPWTPGRVVHYGDWNGDGVPDVAMERQPPEGTSIEVLCSIDARVLVVLWKGPRLVDRGSELPWDLGDVDGDDLPDLILGMPGDSTHAPYAGAVQVVSGATTQCLSVTYGSSAGEAYGSAVAFAGDLDGDGLGDYVVGAPGRLPDSWNELRKEAGVLPGPVTDEDFQRVLDVRPRLGEYVLARSGSNHRAIWRSEPNSAGHGFGSSVSSLGDVDGDCRADLVVGNLRASIRAATVLSGRDGRSLRRFTHRRGPVGPAGDLDGDGVSDLFLDSDGPGGRGAEAGIVSGATSKAIGEVAYPDIFGGDNGITVAVGDVDGDGFDDLAVGETNYNLPGPEHGEGEVGLEELRGLSLQEALELVSRPRSMVSTESGCLLVVSGRTRRPIWGVWGRPDTYDGVGLAVCSIPDVSGDGAPDLVVGSTVGTFVFEGPGPVRW